MVAPIHQHLEQSLRSHPIGHHVELDHMQPRCLPTAAAPRAFTVVAARGSVPHDDVDLMCCALLRAIVLLQSRQTPSLTVFHTLTNRG